MKYKIVNGTSYHANTSDTVVRVLESARTHRIRLHISLGDAETGCDWREENHTHGYISRSTGLVKAPLLLSNSRSSGGFTILDHCIVRIETSAGNRVLYQHPHYHHGTSKSVRRRRSETLPNGRTLTVDLRRDGKTRASFERVNTDRPRARQLGVSAAFE